MLLSLPLHTASCAESSKIDVESTLILFLPLSFVQGGHQQISKVYSKHQNATILFGGVPPEPIGPRWVWHELGQSTAAWFWHWLLRPR